MEIDRTFCGWSTHVPLIKSVLEAYKPKFILELGIGLHSTPLFLNSGIKYIGVETDKEWLEYVKNLYPDAEIIHQEQIENSFTHLWELTGERVVEINDYYSAIDLPELKPNLLFVDQDTCLRTLSINALYQKFDLIIYHDSQPEGVAFYSYDLINVEGFKTKTLKSSDAWTTLLYKEEKELDIQKFIDEYLKEHTNCLTMELC